MAKTDPDKVKKLQAQLKKAKADARIAIDAQRKIERDALRSTQRKPGAFTSAAEIAYSRPGMARVDSVREARSKEIKGIQKLLDQAARTKAQPTMNPTPRHYKYGGSPAVPQYGLGGFLKKVGKIALPIAASFIPGVGAIAAPLVAGMMNGGKKGQSQQAQPMEQTADAANGGIDQNVVDETVNGRIQEHVEGMHGKRTDARASVGSGFRYGGALAQRVMAKGGMVPLGNEGAVEFKGPSHENGGIKLSPTAEVEGGETMDFLPGKGGTVSRKGVPYIFSDAVKVPGSTMTFAKYHKQLVARGADPTQITALAQRQESATGRVSKTEGEYGWGGAVKAAGSWLGKNSGNIAMMAPALMNIGRGALSSTSAPQMQQIQAEQVDAPDASAFGPVGRSGLSELGSFDPVRLNYQEAYARNASALRTGLAGMGTGASGVAGRLAALAGARRGTLELGADKAQRQDMFNAQRQDQLRSQRASLAGQYDMADAQNRGQFASLLQQSRQFNAGQRAGAQQFNVNADYQNQVAKAQAQEAKWNMIGAGVTGMAQYAGARADRNAQRDANRASVGIAVAGASDATQQRITGSDWYNRIMGK